MRPLFGRQRRALLRSSCFVFCGAVALVPMTLPPVMAQGGSDAPDPRTALPLVPQRLTYPAVVVDRDPFVSAQPAVPVANGLSDAGSDDPGIVLPPNDAAGSVNGAPGANAALPIVRAIILGPSPKALVDANGRSAVVGIGSPLGGSTIVTMSANAVELADGTSFPLFQSHP